MKAPLPGNAVVAPFGGPTAFVNASARGVIQEVPRQGTLRVGGVEDSWQQIIEREMRFQAQYNTSGIHQRNAIPWASRTDRDGACCCGHEADCGHIPRTVNFP